MIFYVIQIKLVVQDQLDWHLKIICGHIMIDGSHYLLSHHFIQLILIHFLLYLTSFISILTILITIFLIIQDHFH
jgi:hypothetical protein